MPDTDELQVIAERERAHAQVTALPPSTAPAPEPAAEPAPRPWLVNAMGVIYRLSVTGDQVPIAVVFSKDVNPLGDALATARVMAAGLELLSACKAALGHWYDDDSRGRGSEEDGRVARLLAAAIAKAEANHV